MSGTYIQFGPFDDGGPPGISSSFLNGVEGFLLSINSAAYDPDISSNGAGIMTALGQIINGAAQFNPPSTVLNGGTSGTATLYQVATGTFKIVLVSLSNFKTAGSAQTVTLPSAFTANATILSGFIGSNTTIAGIQLLHASSAVTCEILTGLSSTGGTVSGSTSFFGQSLAFVNSAFDTISFNASSSGSSSGLILIFGV